MRFVKEGCESAPEHREYRSRYRDHGYIRIRLPMRMAESLTDLQRGDKRRDPGRAQRITRDGSLGGTFMKVIQFPKCGTPGEWTGRSLRLLAGRGGRVAAADTGSNFRISGCQYVYNLAASSLGVGTYRVDISIDGSAVGSGIFGLK